MLERNDQPTFKAMLAYASPKHIVPSIPDYNQPSNASKDAFHQQLRLFNGEVAFHAESRNSDLSEIVLVDWYGISRLPRRGRRGLSRAVSWCQGQDLQADYKKLARSFDAANAPDLHFYVDGDLIRVDEPPKNASHDRSSRTRCSGTTRRRQATLKPKPPADPRAQA